MCVHDFFFSLIDAPFSHVLFFHVHLPFCFNIFFSKVTKVLSIVNLIAPPFQKVCGNCHIVDVIISPTGSVNRNVCCSKSMIQKSGFLHGSIATNDELVLLTIEGKWLEAIMHMTAFEFLDLLCPKQIQLFILIRIHGKFRLSPTFALVGF
jgi:hypothetical protein